MAIYCKICKVEQGALQDCSFHSLPTKKEERDQWIAATQKRLGMYGYVCCQHFEEKDFYYKVRGNGVQRYLLPGSVPSPEIINSRCDRNISYHNKKILKLDDKYGIRDAYVIRPKEQSYYSIGSFQSVCSSQGIPNMVYQNNEIMIKIENYDEEFEQEAPTITDEIETENVKVESSAVNEEQPCDIYFSINQAIASNDSTKRFVPPDPSKLKKRVCTPLSIGDLTREDFTSDAAWGIVKDYVKDVRQTENLTNKTIQTLNTKVKYYQKIYNERGPIRKSKRKSKQCSASIDDT